MKRKNTEVAEIEISYQPQINDAKIISSSEDAYNILIEHFPKNTIALQERFVALYLNRANQFLGVYQLSKGGITGTVVDIKILLSIALKIAASNIIIAHNHPSGNLKPSNADIELTNRIVKACSYIDVILLDHLIISPNQNFFSFKDDGTI